MNKKPSVRRGRLQSVKRLRMLRDWRFLRHHFSIVFKPAETGSKEYLTLSATFLHRYQLSWYHWCWVQFLILLGKPPRVVGHYVAAKHLAPVQVKVARSRYATTACQEGGPHQRHIILVECSATDMELLLEDQEQPLVQRFTPETTLPERQPSHLAIAVALLARLKLDFAVAREESV